MLTGNNPLTPRPLPPDRRTNAKSFARAAGSFVPKIAAKAFEKFGFHTAEIMMQWPTIAGRDLAAFTQPERIRWPRLPQGAPGIGEGDTRPGGTLVLRVEPARALDVEYRAAEILDRINRYFGYRAVDTLKIIQAPLTIHPVAPRGTAPQAAKPATVGLLGGPAKVPVEATSLPEDLAAKAGDGTLRSALEELWASVCRQGRR